MGELVHSREEKPFDLGTYGVKTNSAKEKSVLLNCSLSFSMHLVSLNV